MAVTPSQLRADTLEYQAELERRVSAICEADGLTKSDSDGLPEPDRSAIRVALATKMADYDVASKPERYTKALRYVDLVTAVFPSAPAPSTWDSVDDEDERLFAKAIWDKVSKLVESQLRTRSFETLIEELYGRTFCRVMLHPDDVSTPFVYITEDIGCLLQDYSGPRNAAIRRAQEAMVKALRPVITRHPQHGKRLISEFRKSNSRLLEASTEQLRLALTNGDMSGDRLDDDE